MEIYKILLRKSLTPNQFYVLYCMKENVTSNGVNISQELRKLKRDGWILGENKLSAQSLQLIKEIEGYFKVGKKKTNKEIMGDDFTTNLKLYNETFIRERLPSGKAARSALGNIEPAFRWFFQNFEYDWETVLKATQLYVREYSNKKQYQSSSQYVIRKQQTDKTWVSILADYCEIVESGEDMSQERVFATKVV